MTTAVKSKVIKGGEFLIANEHGMAMVFTAMRHFRH